MTKRKHEQRFRSLTGTHSKELKGHLHSRWLKFRKRPGMEHQRALLRRKAQIVVLKMFKFPQETIRKLKQSDVQKLLIDEARKKMRAHEEVDLKFKQYLTRRAREEAKEIIELELQKARPDGNVIQTVDTLIMLFEYVLRTARKVDTPTFDHRYLQTIENVYAHYQLVLLGKKFRPYHQFLKEAYEYVDQLIERAS